MLHPVMMLETKEQCCCSSSQGNVGKSAERGMKQTAEVGFISPAQTLASAQDKVSHSLTSMQGLTALPGWMDGWMTCSHIDSCDVGTHSGSDVAFRRFPTSPGILSMQ